MLSTDAIRHIVDYAEDQGVPVQLTHNGTSWTADFRHTVHAQVCTEELNSMGMHAELGERGFLHRVS